MSVGARLQRYIQTASSLTPVMPNEMENLVREIPPDTEIVTLFQNINEAGPLPLTGARVERAA